MRKIYFKNSVTTLLIISFLVMPFSGIPKKAEAQSLGAYVTGIAPAITQLPLCKGKLGGATKSLFTGQFSAAWDKVSEKVGTKVNKAENALEKEREEAQAQLNAIGTYDIETNKKLRELGKNLNEVKASTASLDSNDTCLKNIGRIVIKMLLQKMTMSTVNWINSGFDGKPAFIQDYSKFFGDIAKNEFLQFGGEINDPKLFPFGKAWIRNQAEHFNNKFADNARYSLDELIRNTTPQYSATGFWLNFDQGGWGAWDAMTRYPQNNSLGFQLMASNELQRRLAGTAQSTAQGVRDALQAADGFLGDQRCVDPAGVTREEHNRGLAGTGRGPEPNKNDAIYATPNTNEDGSVVYDYQKYTEDWTAWNKTSDARTCNKWEYVTPGKLIAEAATSTIHYPENNLLKADDLNDAMAAIMDALLARFSNDLMQKGFANLDSEGADGTFSYAQDSFSGDNLNQTERDFRPIQLASSWLSANPDFNIRTDLTQALIDEQRTYIDKLQAQNKELNSTTDGKDYVMGTLSGESNAYGLIPIIGQLDYCIPGPHPGWEEDSRRVLNTVTNVIIPETEQSVANKTKEQLIGAAQTVTTMSAPLVGAVIGSQLGSVVPVVGTAIGAAVGALVGFAASALIGWFGGDDNARKVRDYYDTIIEKLTGINGSSADDKNPNTNNLSNKQGAIQILDTMLDRYVDIVYLVYNEKVLPTMHRDAYAEFNKLRGYAQIIENNKDTISAMNNVVTILEQIKKSVDGLNSGNYSQEDYKDQLQAQIDAFGRVSANMVNGDDIASADNLLKQIVDEEDYVYNDLLKGPLGCEKELEGGIAEQTDKLPEQLYKTRRMEYPFPILYTYDIDKGGNIPDLDGAPYNFPRYENKTNTKATNEFGPGFLSFYFFQQSETVHKNCKADGNGAVSVCELKVDDILPMDPKFTQPIRLGSVSDKPSGTAFKEATDPSSGPFEYTIGVY